MGMMLNRRRVYGSGKSLPYDAEIEYLESTGTQYIDADIEIYDNSEVAIFIDFRTYFTIYGWHCIGVSGYPDNGPSAGISAGTDLCYASPNDVTLAHYKLGTRIRINADFFNRHYYAYDVDNDVVLYDNTISVSKYEKKRPPFIIFGFSSGRGVVLTDQIIYGLEIKIKDSIVRDLIPVVKDNVGYMYDKVSKQLFGNAGTGDFILGPDKDSTVIITQQQQHEMYGE